MDKTRVVQVYKSDISDLQSELEAMRKALDRERIRGGELEAKLASLDQDMAFQLQVCAGRTLSISPEISWKKLFWEPEPGGKSITIKRLQLKNTELEEERKRHHVDFSAIDTQMKSEYEKRLRIN